MGKIISWLELFFIGHFPNFENDILNIFRNGAVRVLLKGAVIAFITSISLTLISIVFYIVVEIKSDNKPMQDVWDLQQQKDELLIDVDNLGTKKFELIQQINNLKPKQEFRKSVIRLDSINQEIIYRLDSLTILKYNEKSKK